MPRAFSKTLAAATAVTCVFASQLAHAELTANIALTTNYKFRGQDQDASRSRALKPALQGGFDYSFGDSGFYVGNWNSTVDWLPGNSLETDFYGGYKFKAAEVDWDVGALTYVYSGNSHGNTTELYGAGTYGPFTAKYSHSVTNLFGFDDSKNSSYLDLSANIDLGNGWSVVPHVGRQWVRHNSDYSYTDYALTLNKDFGNGLSASAAFVGTNADKQLYVTPGGKFTGKNMLVVGVKYTF